MFGIGVLKGLGVTLKEFVTTYLDDIQKIPSRYSGGRQLLDQGKVSEQEGLFTIQYPEERRKLPERFRYIPVLIVDAETGEDRCTACGICAKVCPPQCIWIVRDKDENGKPITRPSEFAIDTTICMNCGMCAEFCPFDAIKMNHDYEIAAYERMPHLVFDLETLRVPTTYYAQIRPTDWAAEEAIRAEKEAEKAAKEAERAARLAAKAAEASSQKVVASSPVPESPQQSGERRSQPSADSTAKSEAAKTPTAPAGGMSTESAPKRSPEQIARLKAEAAARRAAKAAQDQSEE